MNTEHDETFNRATWRGECIGEMHNPRPAPSRTLKYVYVPELGIELPCGSIASGPNAVAKTSGRKTYR